MTLGLKDIIFVPTIQHTGTWFVLEFLKPFIPNIRELTFLLETDIKPGRADINHEHIYNFPLTDPTLVQIHFPIVRYLNFDVNFPQTHFERSWYSNMGIMRSVSVQTILLMCNFFKTIIPVRNPVAAILSREARHPEFRHFFITDGFIALATEFAKHPNVMFLPIDGDPSLQARRQLLVNALVHVGIDPSLHEDYLTDYALRWEAKNQTPGNRFKEAYEKEDWDTLKIMLGPKWAEIEYFINMASIILPFMASVGYTREMIKP